MRVPSSDAWMAMADLTDTVKADFAELTTIRDSVRKPGSPCEEREHDFPRMEANIDFNSQASKIVRDLSRQIAAMPTDIRPQSKALIERAAQGAKGAGGFDGLLTNSRSSDDQYFSPQHPYITGKIAKNYQRRKQDEFIRRAESLQNMLYIAAVAEIPTYVQACDAALPNIRRRIDGQGHPTIPPDILKVIETGLLRRVENERAALQSYTESSARPPRLNRLVRSFAAVESALETQDGIDSPR